MNTPRPLCRHCRQETVTRSRGLGWRCFYQPGVRNLYPPSGYGTARGIGNYTGTRPPAPEPTTAHPGTPEKLDVLHERAKAGYQLFHEADPRI